MYKTDKPTSLEKWLRRVVRPGPDAIWNKCYWAGTEVEIPDDNGVPRRVVLDYAGNPTKDCVVVLAQAVQVPPYEELFAMDLLVMQAAIAAIKIPTDPYGKPAFEIKIESTRATYVLLADKMREAIGDAIGKIVPVEKSWRAVPAYCSYQINPKKAFT